MFLVLGAQPSHRHAIGLFFLAAAFTALWLSLNIVFPQLQSTGIPSVMVRLIIHVAILTGLWLGLALTQVDRAARIRIWLTVALVFTAWLGLVWWLAVAGLFRAGQRSGVPAIPVAIFLPLLIGLPLLLRSKRIGVLLDAMPTPWLVGLQVYRVFGGIFLVAWGQGRISSAFALPAGTGDVLVGLLALPVANLLYTGMAAARGTAIAWNILGLVDFTIAIALGILTSPGPLQLIVPDVPNAQLDTFPAVMIPTFAVPSSILLHALSLRQLWRRRALRALPSSALEASEARARAIP
ncbi:MAG: MFS transporter [Hyphomicrobiaceae bacterium]|nr:MFS transporter [Hyphomicrobiaceae bacterium]